jgi:hypothetical protein
MEERVPERRERRSVPSPPCPVTVNQKLLLSPSLSSISEMEERVPEGRERRCSERIQYRALP